MSDKKLSQKDILVEELLKLLDPPKDESILKTVKAGLKKHTIAQLKDRLRLLKKKEKILNR